MGFGCFPPKGSNSAKIIGRSVDSAWKNAQRPHRGPPPLDLCYVRMWHGQPDFRSAPISYFIGGFADLTLTTVRPPGYLPPMANQLAAVALDLMSSRPRLSGRDLIAVDQCMCCVPAGD